MFLVYRAGISSRLPFIEPTIYYRVLNLNNKNQCYYYLMNTKTLGFIALLIAHILGARMQIRDLPSIDKTTQMLLQYNYITWGKQ